jgi:Reverse transcriptase (RNA-dependent DNA polymerase)/gag-polypeptide of LTR copia-type
MVAIFKKPDAFFGILILLSVVFNTATAIKISSSSRGPTPLLPKSSQENFSKTLYAFLGRSGGLALRPSVSIPYFAPSSAKSRLKPADWFAHSAPPVEIKLKLTFGAPSAPCATFAQLEPTLEPTPSSTTCTTHLEKGTSIIPPLFEVVASDTHPLETFEPSWWFSKLTLPIGVLENQMASHSRLYCDISGSSTSFRALYDPALLSQLAAEELKLWRDRRRCTISRLSFDAYVRHLLRHIANCQYSAFRQGSRVWELLRTRLDAAGYIANYNVSAEVFSLRQVLQQQSRLPYNCRILGVHYTLPDFASSLPSFVGVTVQTTHFKPVFLNILNDEENDVSPSSACHGKGFSSNNAGDGPTRVNALPEVSDAEWESCRKALTNFELKDSIPWIGQSRGFSILLPTTLQLMLQDKFPHPDTLAVGNFSGRPAYEDYIDTFTMYNRKLYQYIVQVTQKSTALTSIVIVDDDVFASQQGLLAWKALVAHFHSDTSFSRLALLMQLIDLKMNVGEPVSTFHSRYQSLISQIKTLGIKLEDIYTSVFINATSHCHGQCIETLLAAETSANPLTVERVISTLKDVEKRSQSQNEHKQALLASTKTSKSSSTDITALVAKEVRQHIKRAFKSRDNGGGSVKKPKTDNSTTSTAPSPSPTGKWCSHHKSTTHNTDDCRELQKAGGKPKPKRNGRQKKPTANTAIVQAAIGAGANDGMSSHASRFASSRTPTAFNVTIQPHAPTSAIVDSGATDHIFNFLPSSFPRDRLYSVDAVVSTACGGTLEIEGRGSVGLFKNFLYVPHITHNLCSVPALVKMGYKVVFDKGGVYVYTHSTAVHANAPPALSGIFDKGLFHVNLNQPYISNTMSNPASSHPTSAFSSSTQSPSAVCDSKGTNNTTSSGGVPRHTPAIREGMSTMRIAELVKAFGKDLYEWATTLGGPISYLSSLSPTNMYTLWHQRLGHISPAVLNYMQSNSVGQAGKPGVCFTSQDRIKHETAGICHACALGRMRMVARKKRDTKPRGLSPSHHTNDTTCKSCSDDDADANIPTPLLETPPGTLVFMDILLSPTVAYPSKATMALILIDSSTRYVWVYPMRTRDEAPAKVVEWAKWMKARSFEPKGYYTLRSDNDSVFASSDMLSAISEFRLVREFSAPHGHVPAVERVIQTLSDRVRCMLYHNNVPLTLWAHALVYSAFVVNRTVCASDKRHTRYERLFGTKPNLSKLRTFGCNVYARIYDEHRKKWDPLAFKGRFIGMSDDKPGHWEIYNYATHRISWSEQVKFDELNPALSAAITDFDQLAYNEGLQNIFATPTHALIPPPHPAPPGVDVVYDDDFDAVVEAPCDDAPRAPVASNDAPGQSTSSSSFSSSSTTTRPKRNVTRSYRDILGLRAECRLSARNLVTPSTLRQMRASPQLEQWQQGYDSEVHSLARNATLDIMPRPPSVHVLGLKWVFKIKESLDGFAERFKVRCTILGNLQRAGVDYWETFSPTSRHSTVRALLATAASRNYHVHHMDVDTAFLYGVLPDDEPVYCTIPDGYPIPPQYANHDQTQLVARVRKGLYGLRQSPRLWNQTIDHTMVNLLGFTRSPQDPCLYHKSRGGEQLFVCIYVDDLLIASSSMSYLQEFKRQLSDQYNMKDLGELRSFLGMEVTLSRNHYIKICQTKYISDLSHKFSVPCNSKKVTKANIPLDPSVKLFRSSNITHLPFPPPYTDDDESQTSTTDEPPKKRSKSSTPCEKIQYRELVGSLMYLMICTRPDISYAVSYLARYLNCYDKTHFDQAMNVLRYVVNTKDRGITYTYNPDPSHLYPVGYSDSDWGSDLETRRSTTGYVYMMAGGAVSWKTKLQPTVALSSADAEYMALAASAQEALYLRILCIDLDIDARNHPTVLHADNTAAIAMAQNPTMSPANKHIELRHHFIRDHVALNHINLQYVRTDNNAADLFTKNLSFNIFSRHVGRVMGV